MLRMPVIPSHRITDKFDMVRLTQRRITDYAYVITIAEVIPMT